MLLPSCDTMHKQINERTFLKSEPNGIESMYCTTRTNRADERIFGSDAVLVYLFFPRGIQIQIWLFRWWCCWFRVPFHSSRARTATRELPFLLWGAVKLQVQISCLFTAN